MKKLVLLQLPLLILVFLSSNLPSYGQEAGKQVPVKIPITNGSPNAYVYLPWDYNISGKSYPLVLFCHGLGEAGNRGGLDRLLSQGLPGVINNGMPPYSVSKSGDTTKFIVLSIQSYSGWQTSAAVMQGVQSLEDQYHLRIDKNRIYITGLSAGGATTLSVMKDYTDYFAAAVAMSPAGYVHQEDVIHYKNRYIWFIQGSSDNTVGTANASGSNSTINKVYPGHSRITFYNGGHCCWETYYNPGWRDTDGLSIYDFMLQHTLSNEDGNRPVNKSPVAKAGNMQTIILPTNSVILDGSASTDPDGTIVSYLWSKKSGPTSYNISSPQAAKTQITTLTSGTYVFTLTVTDNSNASASSDVTLIVKNPTANKPPLANAGGYQNITLPLNTVKLNATASYDSDGKIASYKWTQRSGPANAVFDNTGSITPTVSKLVAGTYAFNVTVTDNAGATAIASTLVTVKNSITNKPPLANAGSHQDITLPLNTVKLTATASYDPDGKIASYKWTQGAGPTNAVFDNTGSITPTVSKLAAGTYAFNLKVTDNNGATATASTSVTVKNPAANKSPLANAGGYQNITLPLNTVRLNATASYDPDGKITSFKWTQAAGPANAVFDNTGSITPTVSKLVAGTYIFNLLVTDNSGATATARTQVTVKNSTANKPPLANAGGYQNITLPLNTVRLNATASYDSDGKITSFKWTQGAGPANAVFDNTGSITPTVSKLVAGTYIFNLLVTDNSGATATASTLVIVKNSTANKPPLANAGGYQNISLPLNTVRLNATASYDSDGKITSFKWTQGAGPANAVFDNTGSITPTVSKLVAGTYIFNLKVTDNNGATATARTQVTVKSTATLYELRNIYGSNDRIILRDYHSTKGILSNTQEHIDSIPSYDWIKNKPTSAISISGYLKTDTSKADFNIYPNPVQRTLHISFNKTVAGVVAVRIINMNGQVMKTFSYNEPSGRLSKSIHIDGLEPGIYLVQLLEHGEVRGTKKIVKY